MPLHTLTHKVFGRTSVPGRNANRTQQDMAMRTDTGRSAALQPPAARDFQSERSVSVKTGPEGSLLLMARIPGLRAHEIDLDVSDDALTLRGERRRSQIPLKGRRDRRRQDLGPFRRSFALPRGTSREQINASFKDDILTVTIPRSV